MRYARALIVRAAKRREDIRIRRAKPVPKAASNQLRRSRRRRSLHHVVLAVEEVGRVLRIRRHRSEAGKAIEDRRRPLPAVASEIVNSPRADAARIRADWNR